jgi:hypothetical protein
MARKPSALARKSNAETLKSRNRRSTETMKTTLQKETEAKKKSSSRLQFLLLPHQRLLAKMSGSTLLRSPLPTSPHFVKK